MRAGGDSIQMCLSSRMWVVLEECPFRKVVMQQSVEHIDTRWMAQGREQEREGGSESSVWQDRQRLVGQTAQVKHSK